jgi:fumarate hydratase subunit alpha
VNVREIHVGMIEEAVKSLFLKANTSIGQDVYKALMDMKDKHERSPLGKDILDQILKNHDIARDKGIAMCQDTGMAVVFLDVGQDVHFVGGALEEAVNKGVKGAYEEGYFRKSVVSDPLFDRKNTGTNTPAVIHTRIVKGDRVKILAMPKGFGSENMSALKMLTPAAGVEGVKKFVVQTVMEAGPNPCPPTVIGVGIGGTMEQAALIAKRATARPVGSRNEDPRYSRLEEEILKEINDLGIGPGGLGGTTSCLAVHIEFVPGHIAGIPVAVNICCHACRHAEVTI